ncbi:MAG TPA: NAD(P)/FAD-dependent oxidoreductase [Bryobacteraceae bacterium]|nr:NAD(P)/FAD-dependent oxidoreductase [Bryobacteraceae bacterium]
MKTVAVLGGGPAGSFAAERLARAGLKVMVFDEKLAWEKPCGGGLTYKAYNEYPFLIENDTPKRLVHETLIAAPKAGEVTMALSHPLVIYSRFDLNRMLLERAERAGASIEKTRVLGLERRDRGWRLRTQAGSAEADFCIIATGARNPLRDVGTEWSAKDTMSALGYYVPASQERIDIQFLPQLEGYIWVFPRCGHLSVGICGKGEPAQSLRARLEQYMNERGIVWKGSAFYSHMLPSLETPGWKNNRVAGDGWLAVGDAGGLVDPITGEGLYYAMRSGDLASRVVVDDAHGIAEKAAAYRAMLSHEFAVDLEFAATLAKRVFLGSFMFSSVPARMIHFMRRSPRFRELMQDLFAGTQPYLTLKKRLLKNLNGTLQEVLMNFFLNRVIPESSRASL